MFLFPLDRSRNQFLKIDIELAQLDDPWIEKARVMLLLFLEHLAQTPREVGAHVDSEYPFL